MKHIWSTNEQSSRAASWRRLSVWASAGVTILALFAELAMWGRAHWSWDADWLPHLATSLRVALLATSAFSVVVALTLANHGELREKDRARVGATSRAILPELADLTGAPIAALGISVWAVVPMTKAQRKNGPKPRKGRGKLEVLSRVDLTRLAQSPQPMNHTLGKGVGVVGDCWARESESYEDFRKYHGAFKNGVITNSAWKRLKGRRKWGFSQEEYPVQMTRYSDILAVPMKDRAGKFYGCVSLDLGADHADLVTKFDSAEVREILVRHATIVYGILRR